MSVTINITVNGEPVDGEVGFQEAVLIALEGLAQQMVDITTALSDLNDKVDATNTLIAQDATDKAALNATIADLQAQLAAAGEALTAAQNADASDQAAAQAAQQQAADALAQVQSAADSVEAAAAKLNPIAPIPPVPTDGGSTTDGGGTDVPPVDAPPADVPPADGGGTDAATPPDTTGDPTAPVDPISGQPVQ